MTTEWTIVTLMEHLASQRSDDQVALKLQAEKYENRLTKLNGEHATLLQMREDFVLREVYNKDMERLYTERDDARKEAQLAKQMAEATAQTARRNAMSAAGAVLIAFVGWGLTLLFHYLPAAK